MVIGRAALETEDIVCGRPLRSVDRQLEGPKAGVYVVLHGSSEPVATKQANVEHDVLLLTANELAAFPFTTAKNKHQKHHGRAAALPATKSLGAGWLRAD